MVNVVVDLRHQYEIYVAELQTCLLAKRPWRRGARRNGYIRRLRCSDLTFTLYSFVTIIMPPLFLVVFTDEQGTTWEKNFTI